ncbi:MAG TPA: alpha/beta hydrolase [Bacillota bacterium]
MPTVTANGLSMYYEVHGEGYPLVMIIGLGANLDWWDPYLVDRLSRRYRLLLFDNRGAGRTEKPAAGYSIRQFADDTAALMDAVGIDRAHVLGVSMGGMIAQELVLNHPGRVERLILACTHCGVIRSVPPSLRALVWLTARNVSPETLKERHLKLLFPDRFVTQHRDEIEAYWRRAARYPTPPDAFRRQLGAILRFNTCGRLWRIQTPTLIVTGDEDILVPPRNAAILAARIPEARVEVFAGGGHGFIAQFPDRFCEVVEGFLG